MRLSQRPLTGSRLDSELFVNRSRELASAERGLSLGLNVAVIGPVGSGRTSFLHQLRSRLSLAAIHVDGRAWATARDLVMAIKAQLGGGEHPQPRWDSGFEAMLRAAAGSSADLPLSEWDVEAIGQAARASVDDQGRRIEVIVLDEPSSRAVQLLFGAFRDALWNLELQWVVAIRDESRSKLLAPPADAFFGTVVDLQELSVNDAVALLHRRAAAGATSEASARLDDLSADIVKSVEIRQPRPILEAAAAVLQSPHPHRAMDELARAQAAAARLGRTEAMLFEELRHLGPVHAGNELLLDRMGLTRARIAQALQRLEEHGLVVGDREGRRRMYRVTVPSGANMTEEPL